jgi:low temperature requirement protein LtrA
VPAVSEVRSSRPPLSHRIVRMSGRDPHERHRAATPLELLFDLTFVVAFGEAGNQMAHLLAEGRLVPAIVGFVFAMFAACWAWINYSWFASAYDTDDWYFRIATMVVMVGVLILALGLPAMFHSIDAGHDLDNAVMVAGYVVMRVAMIGLWLRAARQDPARRSTCLTYVLWVSVAQIGWIALIMVSLPLVPTLLAALTLGIIEMTGPYLTERRKVETPWHAHHIAERYGLLVIIALGEGIIGTIASLSAVIDGQGWSLEAISVAVAGTGLTFGMWWVYFTMPSGKVLHRFRERGFAWGYWHLPLFMSIAATGAGLHVAAYVVEDEAELGVPGALLTVAVPVGCFLVFLFLLYSLLLRAFDPFHVLLFVGSLAALAASVAAAFAGASLGLSLLICMLAPIVVVVGYETVGHRHQLRVLEQELG